MKAYILGCGGMLGDALYGLLSSQGHMILPTDICLSSDWVQYGDVRDREQVLETAYTFKADVIINLAALTDLEQCEADPINARETNGGGSLYCALAAKELRIPYIYISTAGIFDGKKNFYEDDDCPNPLGIYAKSKYEGELYAQCAERYIALRCGWQQGGCEKDKKFISKIMKQLKAGARELNVVTDKLGSPTYTVDFSRQIETMIDAEAYGVWNAVCKGDASRYEVAVELISLLGLQDKVRINPVSSEFWREEYSAPRPACERLLTTKIEAAGLYVMRDWKTCLREYVIENPAYFKVEV
jgi:dTDP-4-dehydrorhamnose reductase